MGRKGVEVDIGDERWGPETPRRRSRAAVLDCLSKLSFFKLLLLI